MAAGKSPLLFFLCLHNVVCACRLAGLIGGGDGEESSRQRCAGWASV
jgi:hypothetical protein